jgi:uncharacterized protein with HEPN domain
MREAAEKIQAYTSGLSEADFLASGLTVDAGSLNLLVIGEAAVQLTDATRQRESEIAWRDRSAFVIGSRTAMHALT